MITGVVVSMNVIGSSTLWSTPGVGIREDGGVVEAVFVGDVMMMPPG